MADWPEVECVECGEPVSLEKAVPDHNSRPCHRLCLFSCGLTPIRGRYL